MSEGKQPIRDVQSGEQRGRDAEATRRLLVAAVGTLLARKGFKGVGVNAIAREAGVDKVLIYRYFGGLQGLYAAYATESDFWPSLQELAGRDLERFSTLPLAEKGRLVAVNFARALRSRPLTLEIMAWEIVETNLLTQELAAARERMSLQLMDLFGAQAEGRVETLFALIGAGLSYLALRSRHVDVYSGVAIGTDEGWKELEEGIRLMLERVFQPADRE